MWQMCFHLSSIFKHCKKRNEEEEEERLKGGQKRKKIFNHPASLSHVEPGAKASKYKLLL